MAWLLSIAASWLPSLWLVPAVAAAGLWLYGWITPARIAAEVVRLGSIALVGLSVWLAVWSDATAACEARAEAARADEEARQRAIAGEALTQARAEGRSAMDAEAKARSDLETALARLEALPPRCGLSRNAVGALPK